MYTLYHFKSFLHFVRVLHSSTFQCTPFFQLCRSFCMGLRLYLFRAEVTRWYIYRTHSHSHSNALTLVLLGQLLIEPPGFCIVGERVRKDSMTKLWLAVACELQLPCQVCRATAAAIIFTHIPKLRVKE